MRIENISRGTTRCLLERWGFGDIFLLTLVWYLREIHIKCLNLRVPYAYHYTLNFSSLSQIRRVIHFVMPHSLVVSTTGLFMTSCESGTIHAGVIGLPPRRPAVSGTGTPYSNVQCNAPKFNIVFTIAVVGSERIYKITSLISGTHKDSKQRQNDD